MRRSVAALIGVTLLAAGPALAAPKGRSAKAECIAAHEAGLQLKNDKKPHGAHAKFVQCARNECPVLLRRECTDQIAATEKDGPTVLFEAKDDSGNDTTAVKVTMDGSPVASKLTGAAIDVEPGEHVFKFERDDGKTMEQRVLVGEGEKNKKVLADYASLVPKKPVETAAAPPPPPPKKEIPLVTWVAGGVAVAGLASFATFALVGKGKESDLAGSCSPRCTDDEVSGPKTDYLVADISLAIGVVAAAVAVYFAWPALSGGAGVKASRLGPPPWLPHSTVKR